MKKFKHDKTSRRKLNSTFEFPIKDLEIPMRYLKTKNQNFLYNLKSVLCHVGDLDRGHYYSYILDEYTQMWYLCNDEHVDFCKNAKVLDTNAYILVYEKANTIQSYEEVKVTKTKGNKNI